MRSSDVQKMPTNKLDIFVSLACANDGVGFNLNKNLANTLMEWQSVAVVSATETIYLKSIADVRIGELQFLENFFDNPNTLLQAVQEVRNDYYRRFSATPSDEYYLINLLALNVLGDGLIRLPSFKP